jgi:excinuclease ABC subunit B
MDEKELSAYIEKIKGKMEKAAADLNFEAAAQYRDRMVELKNMLRDLAVGDA